MWHPFIAKHLLWACDAQELTTDQSRDVVEANGKPRHLTWSWVSVDYPAYHVVPASVSEPRPYCEILNFDDLCTPDFAVYRCNEENLGLRVKGAVLKLKVQLDGLTRQVRFFQHVWQITGMTFALDCQLNPGCQIGNDSENTLRITFVSGLATTPVAPCTFFLLK